jgi:ABC-type glycerol-3-phosphate transport system permease component
MTRTVIYLILVGGAITMVVPFIWMPQWNNFTDIFDIVPYGRWFLNSVFITLIQTILYLFVASMAAFVFARLHFPGRDTIFLLYLATLMIPGEVTLIPKFILMKELHLIDTYAAVILPGVFNAYGVFLLRQFFLTLPESLEEAAIMEPRISEFTGALFCLLVGQLWLPWPFSHSWVRGMTFCGP